MPHFLVEMNYASCMS